jgi:hypothetical protein
VLQAVEHPWILHIVLIIPSTICGSRRCHFTFDKM